MKLINCSECGRLCVSTNGGVCPDCLEADQKDAVLIKNYIREHPGLMLHEVAEKTGIKERKIRRYLKEGIICNQE